MWAYVHDKFEGQNTDAPPMLTTDFCVCFSNLICLGSHMKIFGFDSSPKRHINYTVNYTSSTSYTSWDDFVILKLNIIITHFLHFLRIYSSIYLCSLCTIYIYDFNFGTTQFRVSSVSSIELFITRYFPDMILLNDSVAFWRQQDFPNIHC